MDVFDILDASLCQTFLERERDGREFEEDFMIFKYNKKFEGVEDARNIQQIMTLLT
jgi:hypothetical protein